MAGSVWVTGALWLLAQCPAANQPAAVLPCARPGVTTQNVTTSRGDLCALVARAIDRLPPASVGAMSGFALDVQLDKLDTTPPNLRCTVTMVVSANGAVLGSFALGAVVGDVRGPDPRAARDCIDVTLDDLLARKVIPRLQQQQHAAPASPTAATTPTAVP
jgi:hypothetical protein